MPVQCTCSTCGAMFSRKPSVVLAGNGRFCSHSCANVRPLPLPLSVLHADGLAASIPLMAIDGSIRAYVIVDATDATWACQWRWHLNQDGYAARGIKQGARRRTLLLHRELLGLQSGDGLEGDHIDRVHLNCRRSNLRAIPHQGNQQNYPSLGGSSKHRGVSFYKATGKWRVQVRHDGRNVRRQQRPPGLLDHA
jgi:hypothetical protein